MEVHKLPGKDVAAFVAVLENYCFVKGAPPSGYHLVWKDQWRKLETACRRFNSKLGPLAADRADVERLTFRGVPLRLYREVIPAEKQTEIATP